MLEYAPTMEETDLDQLSSLFRLLSEKTRLAILLQLARGERNVTTNLPSLSGRQCFPIRGSARRCWTGSRIEPTSSKPEPNRFASDAQWKGAKSAEQTGLGEPFDGPGVRSARCLRPKGRDSRLHSRRDRQTNTGRMMHNITTQVGQIKWSKWATPE